jgi:RNA polymerase sigma-70 factor, ECF subfamily
MNRGRQPDPASPRARGDGSAFEALIREHYDGLVSLVVRYVRSEEEAEDLVQDMFAHFWSEPSTLLEHPDPVGLLYRAARNRALSHLRHERVVLGFRGRSHLEDHPAVPTPADVSNERELLTQLERAVAALPPRCREVWVLRRERGLSNAQVAAALGISVNTVEVQMGNALRVLRARLLPYLSAGFLLMGLR